MDYYKHNMIQKLEYILMYKMRRLMRHNMKYKHLLSILNKFYKHYFTESILKHSCRMKLSNMCKQRMEMKVNILQNPRHHLLHIKFLAPSLFPKVHLNLLLIVSHIP